MTGLGRVAQVHSLPVAELQRRGLATRIPEQSPPLFRVIYYP